MNVSFGPQFLTQNFFFPRACLLSPHFGRTGRNVDQCHGWVRCSCRWRARAFDLKSAAVDLKRSAYRQCAINASSEPFSYIVGAPGTWSLKAFKMRALPFGSVKSAYGCVVQSLDDFGVIHVLVTNYYEDFMAIKEDESRSVGFTMKSVFRI